MISRRARYALHGVAYLAHRHRDAPVPFADILSYLEGYAGGLTLSRGYIAKIFQDLSRAAIVQTSVGCKGGYGLARPPREVAVADVVAALDGRPPEQCCMLSVGTCDNQDDCGVYGIVQKAQDAFYRFLSRETAGSLARKMFGTRTSRRGAAQARKR